jgi:hypothetical protein
MIQFALAFFGLSSPAMATSCSSFARYWAPLVSLLGQPAWLWYAVDAKAWGLVLLSIAYTGVYIRGCWIQWTPQE